MLGFPPTQKRNPCLIRIAVRIDPGVLRIFRTGVLSVGRGAYKPLAIVGGGIEQVTHNLLSRPAAFAPGQVGHPGRNRNEGSMHFIQICTKLVRQAIRHSSFRTPILRHRPTNVLAIYFFRSAIAVRTSSEWWFGSTLVHTFTILPCGSMRKVLRLAMVQVPKWPREPYSSTTLWSGSARRWKVSPSLV